ncbi:uncharacterized protein LOC105828902 [Monomorium pharaonis]|uniref:uncharacterized protein LOC105828902 n=1 Tax=Monomorium pharaonis TaxID=307658 RepID=UPI00063F7282|nr:uncharacterized protein LOC105828902 [Monomorium pharaonis]XP_036139788.1 uncharacterized protein LOC105828902 [Monomorium pharaonis]
MEIQEECASQSISTAVLPIKFSKFTQTEKKSFRFELDEALASQLGNMKVKEESANQSTSVVILPTKFSKSIQTSTKGLQVDNLTDFRNLRNIKVKEEFANQSSAAVSPDIFSENSVALTLSNFQVPGKVHSKQKFEIKKHLSDSKSDKDSISDQSTNYQNTRDRRPKHPISHPSTPDNQLQGKKKMKTYCCRCLEYCIFSLLSIMLIAIAAIFLHENENHTHSSDFETVIIELKKHIYGQDNAIQLLTEALQLDTPSFRVIALVGSTGVGKSYTVEIIKKYFPRPYAIRQYYPPVENLKKINFLFLHPNLIILENLKEDDATSVVNHIKEFEDTYKNQLMTILVVFNIERIDNDFTRRVNMYESLYAIETPFLNEHISHVIIPYEFLSEEVLEKCITDAMKASNLMLTDHQFFDVKYNLLQSKTGCKGAYAKVQVFGREHSS